MTNDPRVAVVIPCYNSVSTLRETLDSALGQTHGNIQIIAVNDGSTDETGDILASYGDRITVLSQQNAGQTVAKINGIAQRDRRIISHFSIAMICGTRPRSAARLR